MIWYEITGSNFLNLKGCPAEYAEIAEETSASLAVSAEK